MPWGTGVYSTPCSQPGKIVARAADTELGPLLFQQLDAPEEDNKEREKTLGLPDPGQASLISSGEEDCATSPGKDSMYI